MTWSSVSKTNVPCEIGITSTNYLIASETISSLVIATAVLDFSFLQLNRIRAINNMRMFFDNFIA